MRDDANQMNASAHDSSACAMQSADLRSESSDTGPMDARVITSALAMNRQYAAEAEADRLADQKKIHRKGRLLGVAAALAAVAVVGLLGYMQLLVNTVSQVSDERVASDLMADEAFTRGSASDAFVEPAAYTVESVEVTDRQVDGSSVVAKANVRSSNGYFAEEREVTVVYTEAEDGTWSGKSTVDSHEVTPLRGIAADEEYGIGEDAVVFDPETRTCSANRWVEGGPDDTWFLTTSGIETITYAFAGDAWSRAGVDDSQLVPTFATLMGDYRSAGGQSILWTAASGSGQLQDLQVTWVDDATGTFGGTFTWTSSTSRRFSSSTSTGKFDGWIDREGNVGAKSDGSAGTLSFSGYADDAGGLNLDYTVYYNGVDRYLGSESVSEASGSVTLYQGMASVEDDESSSAYSPYGDPESPYGDIEEGNGSSDWIMPDGVDDWLGFFKGDKRGDVGLVA